MNKTIDTIAAQYDEIDRLNGINGALLQACEGLVAMYRDTYPNGQSPIIENAENVIREATNGQ